jgi:hypothetical protein
VNNSAASIRSAISTKLGEVTQLQDVKVGRVSKFSGYPACRFYLVGVFDELKDNLPSTFRTYQFAIEVIQETTNKDEDVAEADFEDTIDAVLDKLNSQWTLGGNVDVSVVDGGTIVYDQPPYGPALRCPILLAAKTLIA